MFQALLAYSQEHEAVFFTLYCITTPLHVSGPFLAHHQEPECMYVENGTCFTAKLTVGETG
jgi:hypothetical protein